MLKFAEDLKSASASLRTSACRHPQGSPVSKNYVECAREGARCRLRYVVRGCVSFTKSLTKPQPHLHVQQGCSRTRQSLNGVWCVLCILSVQAATHRVIVHQGLMSTLNAVPLHRFSRLTCLFMVLTFTRGGRGKSTPMAPMIVPIDLACPGTGASCAFSPPLAERRLCCQQLQQHAAVDICQ